MPAKSLRAILGGPNSRISKPKAHSLSNPTPHKVTSSPAPRNRAASTSVPSSEDRLPDLGPLRLLVSLTHPDCGSSFPSIVAAITASRAAMFTPLDLSRPPLGMSSAVIAQVLTVQRDTPPLVSLGHLRVLSPKGGLMREITRLRVEGKILQVNIHRRWEGLLPMEYLEEKVNSAGLPEGVPGMFMEWVMGRMDEPLAKSAEDALVRAGFLTELATADWRRRAESSRATGREGEWNPLAVETVARAATGSIEAVGGMEGRDLIPSLARVGRVRPGGSAGMEVAVPGQGAYLKMVEGALGALVAMVARAPWREMLVVDAKGRWEGGTPGEQNKRIRGEKVTRTGMGRRWREFSGMRFEWVLEEAVGEGLVEVFETGCVGEGIRVLRWEGGQKERRKGRR